MSPDWLKEAISDKSKIVKDESIWTIETVSNVTSRVVWIQQVESVEKAPELEEKDFKIDSTGWEEIIVKWIKFKVNSTWDVWEHLEWKCAWKQIFTYSAMIRETSKTWKQIPTLWQWEKIFSQADKDSRINFHMTTMSHNTKIKNVLWLSMAIEQYSIFGKFWGYWSLDSINENIAFSILVCPTWIWPINPRDKKLLSSVRCLKN